MDKVRAASERGKNKITPVERGVIESKVLCKEGKGELEYILNWPEPKDEKNLLIFLLVKKQEIVAVEYGEDIIELLRSYNVTVVIEDAVSRPRQEGVLLTSEVDMKEVNAVITVGGDGTILWAHCFYKYGSIPPIIAFNLGTPSYLSNFSVFDYKEVLTNCLNLTGEKSMHDAGYGIQLKSRIECSLVSSPKSSTMKKVNFVSQKQCETLIANLQAMNDITLDRGQSQSLTNIECFINGKYLTKIQADGIIVATPTGSTAYNMAAGGPLMHSSISGLLFTPICPFSLSFRPLVFPENVIIRFRVSEDARATAFVSVDGHTRFELEKEESLEVKVSKFPASYIVHSSTSTVSSWCSRIKTLLHWNAKSVGRRSGSFFENIRESKPKHE